MKRRKPSHKRDVRSKVTTPEATNFSIFNPFRDSCISSCSISVMTEEALPVMLNDSKVDESQLDNGAYSSISQLTRDTSRGTVNHAANGTTVVAGREYIIEGGATASSGRGRSNMDENDTEYLEFSELEVTELTLDLLGTKGFVLFQFTIADGRRDKNLQRYFFAFFIVRIRVDNTFNAQRVAIYRCRTNFFFVAITDCFFWRRIIQA